MLSARRPDDLAALRAREFARLDASGLAYLDHAATGLYAASQLAAHHGWLARTLLGNPHSGSSPSRAATAILDDARARVLRFFDVDASTHAVCFTAGASAAIKLVGESYRFAPATPLVLAADNHNSVNGVREYARRAGATTHLLPLDAALRLDDPAGRLAALGARRGLLAFPAQSNFSGVRHPLALVDAAHALGLDVLLDVAAFAPTHPLSLRRVGADFTVLSFHKLFGYPTGLGALVARREALARLARPWFAGGTVAYASVAADRHRLHPGHEGFEDGTPDFLGVAALAAGFDLLGEVGMARLEAHVDGLTRHLVASLAALRHANGAPLVRLHGPRADAADRGGTVAFDVLDAAGGVVPCERVEAAARDAGVVLRAGCFCNPGAAEAAFGLEASSLAACLARSEVTGDDFSLERLGDCLGRPVGALRLSLGLATNRADLARALAVVTLFGDGAFADRERESKTTPPR